MQGARGGVREQALALERRIRCTSRRLCRNVPVALQALSAALSSQGRLCPQEAQWWQAAWQGAAGNNCLLMLQATDAPLCFKQVCSCLV